MTKEELQKLIEKYLNNQATSQERAWLEEWYSHFKPSRPDWNKKKRNQIRNDIYQTLIQRVAEADEEKAKIKKISFRVHHLLPYAAAVIMILSIGYFLLQSPFIKKPSDLVENDIVRYDSIHPLHPILVLENGDEFRLDSMSGTLQIKEGVVSDRDGNVILSKAQLIKTSYLTLITAHRSQYQILLPDGSVVWLNSSSRMTFPLSFEKNKRIVRANGQIYFSIAKNPDRPFIVKTSREEVRVLGTEFVLNHYGNGTQSYVALVEGSVKVHIPDHGDQRLTPGQMLEITDTHSVVKPAVLEELVAWKNNEFVFKDKPLKEAMIELSRWYGMTYQIDPSLEGYPIWGTMSRTESLKTNLENIQRISTGVKFEIKEGRIIVMK